MAEKQAKENSIEDKASAAFGAMTFLIALLILIAGGIHYAISVQQNTLARTVNMTEGQAMLTAHIYSLVVQCQNNTGQEGCPLDELRRDASTALTNHETLAPIILEALPPTVGEAFNGDPMKTTREFISNGMSYAASPQSEPARQAALYIMSQKQLPALWDGYANDYLAAGQKKLNIYMQCAFGLYALILGLLFFARTLYAPVVAQIKQMRATLEQGAAVDPLTGVYNRQMLFKVANTFISSYKRQEQPLCALAVDIDNLQKVNDAHGRAAGDAVIKKIAATLNQALRTSDVIGRIGGGEFAVFLPSIDEYRAQHVGEKLRAAIETLAFEGKYAMLSVSVSVGVAQMAMEHKTPDDMLRTAEVAMRRAKSDGYNRVCVYSATAPAV